MRKQGRTWDGAPVPNVAIRDISKTAIDVFRKLARQSQPVEQAALRESTSGLIEKLHLMEGKYLKRAGPALVPSPAGTVRYRRFREGRLLPH